VLTYGDHLPLVERCIESIRAHCPRDSYRLVVGANEISDVVRQYLYSHRLAGEIDRLHESPVNLNKCGMMERMLADVDTPFLWWLDDDSYLVEDDALAQRLAVVSAAPATTVLWGQRWCIPTAAQFAAGNDVTGFVRSASWYRGRPLPGENGHRGDRRWLFINGGCWVARTAALRQIDWPDRRLARARIQWAEDVFMSEAIRQQSWDSGDIGSPGVVVGDAASRGDHSASLQNAGRGDG
jgi:hypothetical protein